MSSVTVRPCLVEELEQAPELGALLDEYAAESMRANIGPANPQFEQYRKFEELGLMRFAGAWVDGALVGFIAVCTTTPPHYGARVSVTESYFVAHEARKTGAGMMLREQAEDIALEMGSVGLFISAPADGRLSVVLPRSGYEKTNEVFYRRLA